MFIGDGWLPVAVSTWDGPPLVRVRWRWTAAWQYGGWYMNFDSWVKRNRAHLLTRSIMGAFMDDSTLDSSWQMFLSKSSFKVLLTHVSNVSLSSLFSDSHAGRKLSNRYEQTSFHGAITVIANSNRVSIVTSFVYISLPSTISHKLFTTPRNALDPHEQRQTLPSAVGCCSAPTFLFLDDGETFPFLDNKLIVYSISHAYVFLLHERASTHPRHQQRGQTFQTWVFLF